MKLNTSKLDEPEKTPGAKSTKCQDIEKYLKSAYIFRFNTIKQKPEFKQVDEIKAEFKPLDKYKLLTIKRELDCAGYTISKDGLLDILCSNFSPAINPVKQYFTDLFPWDEITDHIGELAATIKARNPEHWNEYFKKWLVAVVANVFIDYKCANHTMLVLTGAQGKFKTTWLENLTPKNLYTYLFTGKLNLESKDTLTLIAEYLYINIDDQLKQLHKKDENELKNLITINSVKYRRPYDAFITEYPHLCSFVGSINGNEFLSDTTGTRRFLPFEVDDINIKAAQAINMDLVYSQAKFLFEAGARYWFNDEEIEVLNKRNEEFAMISHEEQFISFYYSNKPIAGQFNNAKLLPAAILLSELEMKTRLRLNGKKLGEALHKLGFIKSQRRINDKITWVWEVYEKDESTRTRESAPDINK
jgi:predicted P-loop ATPase